MSSEFKYADRIIITLLLKAETLKRIYEKEKLQQKSTTNVTYHQMEQLYVKLFDLGYREMPAKMYQQWLLSVVKERDKYRNKKGTETFSGRRDRCIHLSRSHPFYDGNGRTSRLLMHYIQAYYGLPPAIVFKEDKADYYDVALQETRKQENMEIFYTFMFDQYRKHLEQEITSYTQAMSHKTIPKKGKGNGYSLFF